MADGKLQLGTQLPADLDSSALQLFEASTDGMMIINPATEILYANGAVASYFLYPIETLLQQNMTRLITDDDQQMLQSFIKEYIDNAGELPIQKGEYTGIRLDGTQFTVGITLTTTQLGHEKFLVLFIHDLSKQENNTTSSTEAPRKDTLTGLANKTMCLQFLSNKIDDAKKNHYNFSTFVIDVDQFYKFNEIYGQQFGDEVLKNLAKRIVDACREQDFFARIGPNRFVIVMDKQDTLKESYSIGKRLCKTFGRQFHFQDHDIATKVSMGIVTYPYGPDKAETLMDAADKALNQSKCLGGDQITVYTKEFEDELNLQNKMRNTIQKLTDYSEFKIYYQPEVRANLKKITGLTAHIYWESSLLGTLPMDPFIPLAGNINLLNEIGEWSQALSSSQITQWYDNDVNIPVMLRIHDQQILHPDIQKRMKKLTDFNPAFRQRMYIELSAMFMAARDEHSERQISQRLGIELTLEDFNGDHSSLLYLITQHPFDRIILDETFLTELDTNPVPRKLIRLISELTESRHMTLVIAGVSNEHQLQILQEENCSIFTGPYFFDPMPPKAITNLLINEEGSSIQEY